MNKSENSFAADLRIRFVELLFRDDKVLAVGIAVQSLAAVLLCWKTAEPLFLASAGALLCGGIIQIVSIRRFRQLQELLTRHDRGLNTTPFGLIMFGHDGRVLVINDEAARLLSVDEKNQLLGSTLHSLFLRALAGDLIAPADCARIERHLTRTLREGKGGKVVARLLDGRSYEFGARAGSEELAVVTFEDVTDRIAAEEKIRFMAHYDSLTGLPNRGYFNEIVSEMLASGSPGRECGLAVLDLDDFKQINDTLGHPVGDGLIRALAGRLAAEIDAMTRVGRFGGDEFTIYFNGLSGVEDLALRMERMFERLNCHVEVAGHSFPLRASAGAVLARAAGTDVEKLIINADLALYRAKNQGKNCWRIFEESMDAESRTKQSLTFCSG